MGFTYQDAEAQTDVTCKPHVLEEDELTGVYRSISTQTSLTFIWEARCSFVEEQLCKKWSHTQNAVAFVDILNSSWNENKPIDRASSSHEEGDVLRKEQKRGSNQAGVSFAGNEVELQKVENAEEELKNKSPESSTKSSLEEKTICRCKESAESSISDITVVEKDNTSIAEKSLIVQKSSSSSSSSPKVKDEENNSLNEETNDLEMLHIQEKEAGDENLTSQSKVGTSRVKILSSQGKMVSLEIKIKFSDVRNVLPENDAEEDTIQRKAKTSSQEIAQLPEETEFCTTKIPTDTEISPPTTTKVEGSNNDEKSLKEPENKICICEKKEKKYLSKDKQQNHLSSEKIDHQKSSITDVKPPHSSEKAVIPTDDESSVGGQSSSKLLKEPSLTTSMRKQSLENKNLQEEKMNSTFKLADEAIENINEISQRVKNQLTLDKETLENKTLKEKELESTLKLADKAIINIKKISDTVKPQEENSTVKLKKVSTTNGPTPKLSKEASKLKKISSADKAVSSNKKSSSKLDNKSSKLDNKSSVKLEKTDASPKRKSLIGLIEKDIALKEEIITNVHENALSLLGIESQNNEDEGQALDKETISKLKKISSRIENKLEKATTDTGSNVKSIIGQVQDHIDLKEEIISNIHDTALSKLGIDSKNNEAESSKQAIGKEALSNLKKISSGIENKLEKTTTDASPKLKSIIGQVQDHITSNEETISNLHDNALSMFGTGSKKKDDEDKQTLDKQAVSTLKKFF